VERVSCAVGISWRTVGKVNRRRADIVRIYKDSVITPIFEARVEEDAALRVVEEICGTYEKIKARRYGFSCEEEGLWKLVSALGVRQFIDGNKAPELLEVVKALSLSEALFWYSRFLEVYREGGYWDVYRVSKVFRILYRV